MEDLVRNDIQVLAIQENDLKTLKEFSGEFNLDFDDAYQYTVAEKHDLAIISFDKDFDKTKRGRKTPAQVLDQ